MKPLFCALAFLALLAPAIAQNDAPPAMAQAQPAPKFVKLDNGLVVTPIVRPYSELETMLAANIWSFLVQPPIPDTAFDAKVELRTPGKNTQNITTGTIGPIAHDVELSVGLMPMDGLSLAYATKWKSSIHLREFSEKRTIHEGASTGEIDNPTKNLQNVGASTEGASPYVTPITMRPNGEVTLITFHSGPTDKRVDSELVLVLTAKAPEPPKP